MPMAHFYWLLDYYQPRCNLAVANAAVSSEVTVVRRTECDEKVKHFSFTLRIGTPVKYVVLSIKVVKMLDGVEIWHAI